MIYSCFMKAVGTGAGPVAESKYVLEGGLYIRDEYHVGNHSRPHFV